MIRSHALRFASSLLFLPGSAWAHAFGERYDLPAPLGYFVAGASATVAVSVLVAAQLARASRERIEAERRLGVPAPLLRALFLGARGLSVLLLAAIVISGLYGTRNPEQNLAPTFVWIIWWAGFSLVAALLGDPWPALDPWSAIFDATDGLVRRMGRAQGAALNLAYPQQLGAWPAVALLLAFVWIEVVYIQAATPSHIAAMALAWSAATLGGRVLFGQEAWRRNADPFAIYFATLGRFAPLAAASAARGLVLRSWGSGLLSREPASPAMTGFVLAMLSTVFFDGLLTTQVAALAQGALSGMLPGLNDDRGYTLGAAGIVAVWLFFAATYLVACTFAARLADERSAVTLARKFALTLVPIAVAYNVAHNFSNLAIQGQLLIALASDPLGRGWNLFGTAGYEPDIGIVDARFTWYLAIGAIVAGHVVSVWLAHRLALREFATPRRAVAASLPLTLLMVGYTAISLLVIAEPLVRFGPAA